MQFKIWSGGEQFLVFAKVDGITHTVGLISGDFEYSLRSFNLSFWSGSEVSFEFQSDFESIEYPGWVIDDFSMPGLKRRVDVVPLGGDDDADGISNEDELAGGTDPVNADTDSDGAVRQRATELRCVAAGSKPVG